MLLRHSIVLALALAIAAPTRLAAQDARAQYINPPGLVKPTGYTHVVVAPDGRTVYIAGQVAFDSTGTVVGVGDFRAQAEKVFSNLRIALASVGATYSDLLKTTTLVVDVAANGAALRQVRSRYLDPMAPPANTLIPVAALARPELLIEIEAIGVLRAPLPRRP